ncbi:FxSxx-COOH system tetratricopeptide repeat protein [Streptomyces capoamus]|uniref:FxSxx-COOH system tetratricopeptide repeat protein n=1 Tax=Streptomyces capoamus TaxID=68183 RepID=UPI003C2BC138
MSSQEVFIVSSKDETHHAELVAQKLRAVGYRVSHNGTVPVGGSIVEAGVQALDRNVPVVLCATQRAVGSAWTHQLVNAARARSTARVFVVLMEAEAYVGQLAVDTVVARYCDDPIKAMADLVGALQKYFPCPQPAASPQAGPAGGVAPGMQFLDAPSLATEFDHDVVHAFRVDLHEDVLKEHPAALTTTEFLKRAGVWTGNVLTRTGVLMFTRYPGLESLRSMVKCVQYFGTDRSAARHAVTLEGPVTELITGARDFVARQVQRGEHPHPEAARSVPVYELPMIAVREIIANALVHRDYERTDACVHIRLFSDRLEVSNPGTWPGGALTDAGPQDLTVLEGHSVKRNFQLARLLTWNRLVEGEGSGIPTAAADCDAAGSPPARVVETDGFITVTLLRRIRSTAFTGTAPPRWPVQIGLVPRPADNLVARQAERALLDAVADGQAVVITGLGGVGKTQLAAVYATEALSQGRIDLLVWVSAASRESVLAGYAQAATALRLAAADDLQTAARLFLNHLATADFRWLVVLDDILEPTAVSDLWPPRHRDGKVVATSRRRDSALISAGQPISLDVLSPEQSVDYLSRKLAASGMHDEPAQLAELADSLGHLPLALAHAAAYMADVHLDSTEYLHLLQDRRILLQDLLPDDAYSTLSATWELSVAQADQLRPLGVARPMLEFASLLSPNGIPLEIFLSTAALEYLSTRAPDGTDAVVRTRREARAGLGCLHRLGLVSFETDRGSVWMHRLIQRVTLENLPSGALASTAVAAADALAEVWPPVESDAALAQVLRDCTNALVAQVPDALLDDGVHPVLLRLAASTGTTMPLEAVRYLRWLATECSRRQGPDHPQVLNIRSLLAQNHAAAGDLQQASAELERLVADTRRILGPHPETLRAAHDFAWCLGQSGHLEEAVAALTEVLREAQDLFGPDHPTSFSIRGSLATWRGECGDTRGALAELRELLPVSERMFGPDHRDTMLLRGRLAWFVGRSGDASSSVRLWRDLIADQTRVLGADHPDTLVSGNNLASSLGQAGDVRSAADLQKEILAAQRRILGAEHPATLTSTNNLASWLGQSGDAREATRLLVGLALDRARVLGPEHPDAVATRSNLAYWLGKALEASRVPADALATPVRRIDAGLATWVTAFLRDPTRTVEPWQELVDRALAAGATDVLDDLVRVDEGRTTRRGWTMDIGSVAVHIGRDVIASGNVQGNVVIEGPGTRATGQG